MKTLFISKKSNGDVTVCNVPFKEGNDETVTLKVAKDVADKALSAEFKTTLDGTVLVNTKIVRVKTQIEKDREALKAKMADGTATTADIKAALKDLL